TNGGHFSRHGQHQGQHIGHGFRRGAEESVQTRVQDAQLLRIGRERGNAKKVCSLHTRVRPCSTTIETGRTGSRWEHAIETGAPNRDGGMELSRRRGTESWHGTESGHAIETWHMYGRSPGYPRRSRSSGDRPQ